jgi:hypothetical protein
MMRRKPRGKHSMKRAVKYQLTHRRRSSVVIGAAVAFAIGISGGSAYGFIASTGSGTATGQASTGTMLTVTTATAGTPSSLLLPGGTGDVVFSAHNPNSFPVSLIGVALTGTIINSVGSTCTTTDASPVVALSVPSTDLPVLVPGNTTQTVHLAHAATMDATATTQCQGATFSLPLTITVHSS